jgi:hypothetical protein
LDTLGRAVYPESFEATTATDGSFRISELVAPGRYEIPLVVEAKGFKTARLDVKTLEDNIVEARLANVGSDRNTVILSK